MNNFPPIIPTDRVVEPILEFKEGRYNLIMKNCTAYYEYCVNPSGCRDVHIGSCDNEKTSTVLLEIVKKYPLSSEIIGARFYSDEIPVIDSMGRVFKNSREHRNSSRAEARKLYGNTDSKVRWEVDLYNGTDQSMYMFENIFIKPRKFELLKFVRVYNVEYWRIVLYLHHKEGGKNISSLINS